MQKFQKQFPIISGMLIAATLGGVFVSSSKAALAEAAKPSPKLEEVVKALDLPYKVTESGKYIVAFSLEGTNPINMVIGESALGKTEKLNVITITALIQDGVKEKKLSAAEMAVILNFDYQTDTGRVGLDSENNVWYQASLWESTVNTETLTYEMCMAYLNEKSLETKLKTAKASAEG